MGATLSNLWQAGWQGFPPKPAFSADQIPDLTGRVALVTGEYSSSYLLTDPHLSLRSSKGGNTGIGYETCKVCAVLATNLHTL